MVNNFDPCDSAKTQQIRPWNHCCLLIYMALVSGKSLGTLAHRTLDLAWESNLGNYKRSLQKYFIRSSGRMIAFDTWYARQIKLQHTMIAFDTWYMTNKPTTQDYDTNYLM